MSETTEIMEAPPLAETVQAPTKAPRVNDKLLVIEPPKGWTALNLPEMWQYRDLLRALALRDLKVRYKQTALGVAWVVLQPLAAAGIFSFVFGIVAGLKSGNIPYFVFSFTGLLGYNLFGNTLTRTSTSLVGSSQLISKVYFPRLALPVSTLGSIFVDFLVSAALMVVLLVVYRIVPGWGILMLPVWIAMLLMLSLGAGLWAAALTVSYRDVQYLLPVLTQLLLYGSPVGYAAAAAPAKYQPYVYINPLSAILEGFRWSLLGTNPPPAGPIVWSAIASLVLFLGGTVVFKKMERKFADVI